MRYSKTILFGYLFSQALFSANLLVTAANGFFNQKAAKKTELRIFLPHFKKENIPTIDGVKIESLADGGIVIVISNVDWKKQVEIQQKLASIISEPVSLAGKASPSPYTEVFAEIEIEGKGKKAARPILNLLRSTYRPEHWQQLRDYSEVFGRKFQKTPPLSKGFLTRLLDPEYDPTLIEFYQDYIYRQGLENLGVKNAWELSIREAKKFFEDRFNEIKESESNRPIEIESAIVAALPEEMYSRKVMDAGKKLKSVIKFSGFPIDKEALSPAKQALGLIEAAKQHGYYDHDKLLSAFSRIPVATIQELRQRSQRALERGETVLIHNLFGNPELVDVKAYSSKPEYKGVVIPVFTETPIGRMPVVVPGRSVAWHRWSDHGNNILASYNPGLPNPAIQGTLENKFVEYAFWEHFAPGAMQKSKLVSHLIPKNAKPEQVAAAFKNEFPGGWILKGAFDSATVGNLVTDKIDIAKALNGYYSGDYNKYMKSVYEKFKGKDPDEMMYELTQHPDYFGYKLAEAIRNPDESLVQAKVAIDKEYRLEIIGGKVMGNGSTVDRWAFLREEERQEEIVKQKQSGKKRVRLPKVEYSTPEQIEAIERHAQSIVDRLPPAFRSMPFGMDVARLTDGSFTMIESNLGGNSGFLTEDPTTVAALHDLMRNFPERVRSGDLLADHLTTAEETAFLKSLFKEFNINPKKSLAGYRFLKNRFYGAYDPTGIDPSDYTITGSRSCVGKFKRVK